MLTADGINRVASTIELLKENLSAQRYPHTTQIARTIWKHWDAHEIAHSLKAIQEKTFCRESEHKNRYFDLRYQFNETPFITLELFRDAVGILSQSISITVAPKWKLVLEKLYLAINQDIILSLKN